MTPEEAIKRLWMEKDLIPITAFDRQKALRLGIEALEREQAYRKHLTEMGCKKDIELLPSETEEGK